MAQFQFQGDWNFEYHLPAFKGFIHRDSSTYGMESPDLSDGTMLIEFSDGNDSSPDPTPAQLKAFDFLIENQNAIVANMMEKFRKLMHDWLWSEVYEFRDDDSVVHCDNNNLHDDLLKSLLSPSSICINLREKEGMSEISIGGSCDYDHEHGFGFRLHGLNILQFDSDAGMSDSHYEFELKGDIIDITPHPKYGKLKPWQKEHNQLYLSYCVANGLIKELESYIARHPEENVLSQIQAKHWQWALKNDHYEMLEFLLSKGLIINPFYGSHNYGNTFGKKTAELFLSKYSEQEKNDFYTKMLLHHMQQVMLSRINKQHSFDVASDKSTNHIDRISFINSLSNGEALTQSLIYETVDRFLRQYDVSSSLQLEDSFYPLMKVAPDTTSRPYHQTKEEKNLSYQNDLVFRLEFYMRAFEYTQIYGSPPDIGSTEKYYNEIKERIESNHHNYVLSKETIDLALERIKKILDDHTPAPIYYHIFFPLIKNPPANPGYEEALIAERIRLERFMSSELQQFIWFRNFEHVTSKIHEKNTAAACLERIEKMNSYHNGKILTKQLINDSIKNTKSKMSIVSNDRIFKQDLYPLVNSPEASEQNKNWFQRLFDGF
jgi:hypothetical protein